MNLSPNPAVNVSVPVTLTSAGSIPLPSFPFLALPLLQVLSKIKELIQLKVNQFFLLLL